MAKNKLSNGQSAFAEQGLKKTLASLLEEIQALYVADQVHSGGKDSTAALQLVWLALDALPETFEARTCH